MGKRLVALVLAVGGAALLTGCPSPQEQAQNQAQRKAEERTYYVPTHDVEANNYNARLKISDDPTTILWCTSAFPIPSSPLFTVPIAGKLTSSTKRPFPGEPDAQSMYGPSDPYRYGFTPAGVYVEFGGTMPTYCTTQPTVWQRDNTTIALQTAPDLAAAQVQARAALARGDKAAAERILTAAIAATQNASKP